jgi:hypothetical protein
LPGSREQAVARIHVAGGAPEHLDSALAACIRAHVLMCVCVYARACARALHARADRPDRDR